MIATFLKSPIVAAKVGRYLQKIKKRTNLQMNATGRGYNQDTACEPCRGEAHWFARIRTRFQQYADCDVSVRHVRIICDFIFF